MATDNQENEVKFYLADLQLFESQVLMKGATLKHPRVFESNLRFDLPSGELTTARRVLRLRKDDRARLTYKGPMQAGQLISSRSEIELVVSDFDQARKLLESLGYVISVKYEKWRTTYQIGLMEIDIDELPYGNFCELEGPNAEAIQLIAGALKLNWDARVLESYLALFDKVRITKHLKVKNLTFDEFKNINLTATDLGLTPAFQP
jgi:adenylate cyclase, class 2